MKAILVKYYQPVILFALTLTIASVFAVIGVEPYHQGIMFKPAFDIAHGQMLFRDTFTQYGALTTLLQAWALRIFGDYVMVIQIETAFFYGLISVCLYYLWLNILPRWLTTISVVIWLFLAPYFVNTFLPWPSVYALFFQLFSLLLVLRALREQNRLMIMLAGGVAVFAFWCRQPVGVCHCASLVIFLATTPLLTGQQWKNAMKNCAFFIAGIVTASVPFFVWLALNDAIHDMYLQSIKSAFIFGTTAWNMPQQSTNLFMKILRALTVTSGINDSLLWFLLPLVCLSLLAILAVKTWYNRDSVYNNLPLYGILLVSLASWHQYFPISEIRHCYWAATPMIGVFSYGTWQLCKLCIAEKKGIQILIVCLILASVFGFDTGRRIVAGFKKITCTTYTKIEEPKVLRGMYVYPYQAITYQTISTSLNNAIKRNPFSYLVNLSGDALYSTFIGPQNNFHPLYIPSYKAVYPDYINRLNEFINTRHPIVLYYKDINVSGWTCVEIFNAIDTSMLINIPSLDVQLALYRVTGNNDAP
jgi:hypothetical protein